MVTHHMVILRSQNKITDFFMISAWASPFKHIVLVIFTHFKFKWIVLQHTIIMITFALRPLTRCCGFHYETYVGINPYHTLVVDLAQCMVV